MGTTIDCGFAARPSFNAPCRPLRSLPETLWSIIQTATIAEGIYDLDLLLVMFPSYRDLVEDAFGERMVQHASSLTKFSITQFEVPGSIAQSTN